MNRRLVSIVTAAQLALFASSASGIDTYSRPLLPELDCAALETSREASADGLSNYVRCVLNNSVRPFYYLYLRHLRDYPRETGDVDVRFTVLSDGTVQDCVASSAGVTDAQFLKQVSARLRLIKFQSAGGNGVEVTYTFPFSKLPEDK
jgi:hypothetical protein